MVVTSHAEQPSPFQKNPMTLPSFAHTTMLIGSLTALVLLGACSKTSESAPRLALHTDTTTLGSQVDDAVVTSGVKKALMADPAINSFDLQVETRNGTVQLSGFVDDQAQIAKALAITRTVTGVKTVENGVTLKGSPSTVGTKIGDATVTGRIKTALLADPDIRSFDISVLTFKGMVQLTGFVNNQSQIKRATQIASATEGANSVKNELMVKQ
jgi:hyperosmotically inducible protein